MNFIKHSMAAHEQLRARPEASPHHVALYWALFFAWNADYFPSGFDLDHAAIRQAAHIGNKRTYTAALYDLEAWGLIAYQPSKSKHHPSRCFLTELPGAEVPPVNQPTRGKSAPGKQPAPVAEVPQALRAEVPPVKPPPGAEVPQDTLLVKTADKTVVPNVDAAPQKKSGEVFSGEGLSEVQVLDGPAVHDGAGSAQATAPKDFAPPANRVAREMRPKHFQGVGQEPPPAGPAAPAPPHRPRRHPLPELPFSESALASPEAFAAAFVGTDYELADLRHYYQLVATWRDKKTGREPLRRDWVATAKRFMLNDAADNRLKLDPRRNPARPPGASHGDPVGSGIPVTGYRSKRWD